MSVCVLRMSHLLLHVDRLVMAGFVYAIFDNEESVYQILHTCSTKIDRTLDDGRCEYYLEVYSQRPSSRRKSVSVRFVPSHDQQPGTNFALFRFRLFLGSWWVMSRTVQVRHQRLLVSRKILNGQQKTILHPMDTPVGSNVSVRRNVSIEQSLSELCMEWWRRTPWLGSVRNYSVMWSMRLSIPIETSIPLVNTHSSGRDDLQGPVPFVE